MNLRKEFLLKILLVLLTVNGVALAMIGNLYVIPLFVAAPFIMIIYFTVYMKGIGRAQQRLLGVWGLVALFSFLAHDNLASPSFLHLTFYFVLALCALGLFTDDADAAAAANKAVIAVGFGSILVTMLLHRFGLHSQTLDALFRTVRDHNGELRYAGFAMEPSYFGMFMSTAMLVLCRLYRRLTRKQLLVYAAMYVVSIVISKTTTGFIGLAVAGCYALARGVFFGGKPLRALNYSLLALVAVGAFLLLRDNAYFMRLVTIWDIFTGSRGMSVDYMLDNLVAADSSAFFRIGPTILYFGSLDFGDLATWIGHGDESSVGYFSSMLFNDGTTVNLPFLPTFFYSWGLLGGAAFIAFMLWLCRRMPALFAVYMLMCLANSNVATTVLWFYLLDFAWLAHIIRCGSADRAGAEAPAAATYTDAETDGDTVAADSPAA